MTDPAKPSFPLGASVRTRPQLARLLVVALAGLAVAAFVDGGALLLHVDQPIGRWVVERRTPVLTQFFEHVTLLGTDDAVLLVTPLLVAAALLRSRPVAVVLAGAAVTRPVVQWVIKQVVGRHRPQISQLMRGHGPSFPSGHVMASGVLWCSFAVVLGLYVSSERAMRIVRRLCVGLVVVIGLSRVYLGVHWPFDVLAGGIAVTLLLALADHVLARAHAAAPDSGGVHAHDVAPDLVDAQVLQASCEPALAVVSETRV